MCVIQLGGYLAPFWKCVGEPRYFQTREVGVRLVTIP